MIQEEKTIRFEDFAAVPRDSGEVLGKVLYYSLSSILIDREELKELCDDMGISFSSRSSFGDAFRSATGDVYDRRVVKTVERPPDLQGLLSGQQGSQRLGDLPELVKETVLEDTNRYRKLANITFRKDSKVFSFDNPGV